MYYGIDIGGTDIKGLIVDKQGQVKFECKTPTQAEKGLSGVKESLQRIITILNENTETTILMLGVASAGDINPDSGKVIYATENLPGYTGFELKKFLEKETGLKTSALNDADAALLGEMEYGALKDSCFHRPAMLTFGTGVGGAYAINGEIHNGHFGHICIEENGLPCTCGLLGCAETYLSASALLKQSGCVGLAELFNNSEKNKRIVLEFVKRLERLLELVDTAVCPDAFIFGGGLVYFSDAWLPLIAEKIKKNLIIAKLKNHAGALGAIARVRKIYEKL